MPNTPAPATIAGYSYSDISFDKDGKPDSDSGNSISVNPGTEDLFIFSHGWRNSLEDARTLYEKYFDSFHKQSAGFDVNSAKIQLIGIVWPAERFDEHLASPAAANVNAASVGGNTAREIAAVQAKLDEMEGFFTTPEQLAQLDSLRPLVSKLEMTAERAKFVQAVRALFSQQDINYDAASAQKGTDPAKTEDAAVDFFHRDPDELMKDLKTVDTDDEYPAPANAAGGAAGFMDFLDSFRASAFRLLNYATYYEMKLRAGRVGEVGLAPIVNKLAESAGLKRIHLMGHSFGGRVVTATAAHTSTAKLSSLLLLQAAFSHNGLSSSMNGVFRNVVTDKKVNGPLLITYSEHDNANGIAYPIASRLSNDRTCAFGDKNDVFGAIGRNGAQKMQANEVKEIELLELGAGTYDFTAKIIYNINGANYIVDHGAVTGEQITRAQLSALFPAK